MSQSHHDHRHYPWLLIMCLCGVDYFSTLGYQPSIAFEGAGTLAPLATLVLVLVTLFGALPIYSHVAGETPDGVGSIGMIERMFKGWGAKLVVLVLIGFAATDFVITKTLSAADAAAHLISNPLYENHVPEFLKGQMPTTMFLLVMLGAMFLKGYGEVVGVATVICTAFLGLSLVVVLASVFYLTTHPALLQQWFTEISTGHYHIDHAPLSGTGPWVAMGIAVLVFPKLALGLSGFETGVLHIHMVRGTEAEPHNEQARIANTRRMMLVAALIMSCFLIGSSLATGTNTLIPADELRLEPVKGKAMDRALAYIAHGESPHPICPLFGSVFGTIYDISTILILWFAGASAMGGLLNMVPRYLPRYGMAPDWASAYRPLVLAFTVINLIVTIAFRADVSAQGGAYATGVLVLMTSACIASFLHEMRKKPEPHHGLALYGQRVGFGLITLVFVYTTLANMIERPDGIIIASIFIGCVMAISFTSRFLRSDELRLKEFRFADPADRMLWTDIILEGAFRVLVPHRPGSRSLAEKEAEIRRKHRIPETVPIVFLEVHYGDVSEFQNAPIISARQEGTRFVIVARDVVSVSHTIAQVAMEMTKGGAPLDIIFGWSKGGSLKLALDYVLFGQGDVPNRVVDLLDTAIADPARRPTVIVG
ncbi:MAG: amino acid transporter [Planctomycetes bacterium]|nr:amino acid transporter [Planctomycetota bacterium]